MAIIGELRSAIDIVENIAKKMRLTNESKVLNKILTVIYKVGKDGTMGVSLTELQEIGFSKAEIIMATEIAEKKEYILNISSHDGVGWLLSLKGKTYVESLIEK